MSASTAGRTSLTVVAGCGDWEGDTIVGKGRRSALLTLVEQKSGYVRIGEPTT